MYSFSFPPPTPIHLKVYTPIFQLMSQFQTKIGSENLKYSFPFQFKIMGEKMLLKMRNFIPIKHRILITLIV